jgi:hypothetical protein
MNTERGIVVCAHNNGIWDYVYFARKFYERAKGYLNLPLCLISDSKSIEGVTPFWDKLVIVEDIKRNNVRLFQTHEAVTAIPFLNSSRIQSYFLSPFDKTLSIDVDYLINSDDLLKCFDQFTKLMCNAEEFDSSMTSKGRSFISDIGPETYWTTVMYFEKCLENDTFFTLCEHVAQNWDVFVDKYKLRSKLFRNDFAFAIAAHIFNNKEANNSPTNYVKPLPTKQFNLSETEILVGESWAGFNVIRDNGSLGIVQENVHVMNKHSLTKFYEDS